jgi:hypothetical protein
MASDDARFIDLHQDEAHRSASGPRAGNISISIKGRLCKPVPRDVHSAASTAHGVRKAAAALMYENGANEAELCSIFGWRIGSRMAAYYAKKYNARRTQTRALGRLLGGENPKRGSGAA